MAAIMAETQVVPADRVESTWRLRWGMVAFLVACLAVGAPVGVAWALTAPLPTYVVNDDLTATMAERGLAGVISADAAFAGWMALLGLVIGGVAWWRFQRFGWWVAVIAVLGGGLAALVAWRVGLLISPEDFSSRLTVAKAGDTVAIDLSLRAKSALLVAPFLAITPIMLLSAFLPDPDEAPAAPAVAPLAEVVVPAVDEDAAADRATATPVAAD